MKGRFWRKALAAALALLIVSGSTPIQPLSQVFEDIAITASAESTITPVTPQLDSDGFYSIGSAEELYGFAELVNSGNASANAKLTADIVVNENVLDANGEANTGDFVQWTPIGNDYFEVEVYSGTFDGQGHTISGLYVSGNGWFVGFVGEVSGSAVVKNLGIVDSYFSSSNNYLGSIVGGVAEKSSVTIANVYSTSTVKGDNWIGGLVGNGGRGSVSVVNSYFAGKTSANWTYGAHHDDLVSGSFNVSNSGTLNIVNTFVVGTSQYGTSVTAEQLSDGTVAAALHYYQDALADGSMWGISDGKTNFSGTIDGVSVTTADVTLHTFDGDATTYSSKYIVGNTTPLPVNVVREGYTFLGWYDNADFEGDAVTQIPSSATGDKEYWAKFVRSHSVSFVLNEGSIFKGEIDHYIEGETTVLPTFVTKNGASFEGWYTTEDFTGSRYYSIPATATEDMTFYAKWGAEKTTFYLMQGIPEPMNILYEGENVVYLDKTTMDRYYVSDEGWNYWGGFSGSVNVPYTGGESTFGSDVSRLSVAQSGFYVFTLTDKGDGNWFISVLRSLENCTISDIPDQTYTGSEIAPEITVTDGEKTLTLGTDYEVTYSDNTNADTAKATITGKGNYSGTVEKTFAINRATPTVTAPTAKTLTYNGGEQELVTAGDTDFGKVLYSLDGTNYSKDIPKATDAGKYTVYYKVDTDNYYYAPQTVEVTIAESYTITWKNGDETLETDNYVPGDATPEYNGETPTKDATAQYTYTFSGWSDGTNTYAPNALPAVSGDVTYTAQFDSEVNKYTVTWKNGDTILEADENVPYGTTPTYDGETPTKAATAQYTYTFSGWSPAVDAVTGNATYTAQFSKTVNKYTVTWKSDDTVLETDENVEYGATPEYNGETPTREANAQCTYTFKCWKDDNWYTYYPGESFGTVIGNITYTAAYDFTINEYTVTWVDGDGNILETENVQYGSMPSAYNGDTPTKTADAQYTYTFSGWDNELSDITGDTTYTAQFNGTVNKYTVTWKNGDTVLETDENVEYGATPEYNGEIPTKPMDDDYTYTFSDWSPAVDTVTGNVTYTAQFTATARRGDCGANATWCFDPDTGKLTISGTGEMKDYYYNGDQPWYNYKNDITSIEIEYGVKSIGDYAFKSCISLTSITIPDSVESIGYSAFEDCTRLKSITIPEKVTSIGGWAFSGCTSLTSVTIPDSVESIGILAFQGCTGLTSITIPDSVTSIGADAFFYCTNITDVYCYANPNTLTWDDGSCDDFIKTPKQTTVCHVPKKDLETYEENFGNVNVRFVGDVDMGLGEHLYGYSITLDGSIGVNFYVELTDELLASETAEMVFTVPNGSKTETQTLLVKDVIAKDGNKVVIGSKTYYKFKCSISAKDMASEITAQLVDGEKSGTKYTYSVKDYADYLLAHTEVEQYANAAPLVKAMLNYGAASQTYFGIEGTAANARLDDADKALDNVTIPAKFEYDDNASLPTGVTFEGATLSLKSETTLSLYFKGLADGTKFTCDGKTVETVKNGEYVVARIRGIKASELENRFTVKFEESSETYNVTYNVMTYCYNVLNDSTVDDNLKNVCKALYQYAEEASEYFGGNN